MGCSKLLVVVFLVLMAEASIGECIRPGGGGGKDLKQLFSSQLPRGQVPPSGPSFCHNKLGPYKYTQFSYGSDYVNCP
ncbi:Detected protein of unknown function [Hibiscus syriacus]|uniref:Uncharacterized protein n=1 Tax=Hibiscus syriacus TaxID=106335 RepID=A0A6A3B0N3_HIBSY|nr:Detected protein of unknown function [Hibiscus syriacus]